MAHWCLPDHIIHTVIAMMIYAFVVNRGTKTINIPPKLRFKKKRILSNQTSTTWDELRLFIFVYVLSCPDLLFNLLILQNTLQQLDSMFDSIFLSRADAFYAKLIRLTRQCKIWILEPQHFNNFKTVQIVKN